VNPRIDMLKSICLSVYVYATISFEDSS